MDKSEAMKRLDAIEADAQELRRIIEEPKPDHKDWIGKWGFYSDSPIGEKNYNSRICKLDDYKKDSDSPFIVGGARWRYFSPVTAEELGLTVEPDWSKAPEWAGWWARDANGAGSWYDDPPSKHKEDGWWGPSGMDEIDTTICPDWENTLRKRPE